MGVNIADHFERQKQAFRDRAAKAQADEAALKERIAGKQKDRAALAAEKKSKKSLMTQAEAEGLDIKKLDEKLADLDRQIEAVTAEINDLKRQVDELSSGPAVDFNRIDNFVQVLKLNDCLEAAEVDGVAACVGALAVGLRMGDGIKLDDAGSPIECLVRLAAGVTVVVPVNGGNRRFSKGFRPALLDWIPVSNGSNEVPCAARNDKSEPAIRAWLDASSGRLIVTRARLQWRERDGWENSDNHGRQPAEKWKPVTDDFSDLALCLEAHMGQLIQAAGGALNLDHPYADNALMEHVRLSLLPQTTPEPQFRPFDDQLESSEIYRLIKEDWDAFVKAPWSGSICGSLALLKHHLEGGERAKFWCEGFEGAYGFRLRTRDHDWIKGLIFVGPKEGDVSKKALIQVQPRRDSYGSDKNVWIASLGRMWLQVDRSAD